MIIYWIRLVFYFENACLCFPKSVFIFHSFVRDEQSHSDTYFMSVSN